MVPQPAAQPLLALPLHTVKELATLSSDALDTENIARELIAADYVFETGPGDNLHMDIVRKQLTRKLPLLVSPVYEELMLAMRSWWPTGEQEWNSFKLYPTCTAIISRAAIRAFAGERLCRTSEFVEASYHYTEACFAAGPLIQLTPSFLRPAIAPMVKAVFKVNHHFDEAKRIALPVIHERIAAVRAGTSTGNTHRPEDVLQWMVEAIVPLAEKDPTHLEDNRLTARLLGVNMAAIHTTSITMTNILISLYTSPDRDTYLAGLREEVERVLRENDGEFTVKALASLHRTDSTIREAMRCHPLTDDGFRREVVAKGGIHLSDGLHLPFGLRVVVPAHAIHRDKDIYGPTADDFDAFRFSRPYETHPREMDDNTAPVGSKPTVMTTTSEEFFSFSHGRHACPGRFFASMEMKVDQPCVFLELKSWFCMLTALPARACTYGNALRRQD